MGEDKKDIRNEISIQGKGTDAVISVRPIKINTTGQGREKTTGEPLDVLRVGQTADQDLDTNTLYEQAWRAIRDTGAKFKHGEAVVDSEVEGFNKITAKLTQKGEDAGRGLRKDMAGMIQRVNETSGETANQTWRDLNDPRKTETVKGKNFEMGLLYDYIQESGGDPQKLDWQIVAAYGQALVESFDRTKQIKRETLKALADASIRDYKGREEFYQKLLMREGYADAKKTGKGDRKWKDWQEREKAFDVLLGVRQPEVTVDPVRFLKREFYEQAVRTRLEAMRSSAVAHLEIAKGDQKMEIARPKEKEKFFKGYSPALVFQTVSDETEVGKFLDQVDQGAYWRGKACIDVLYWSFYKGQIMSNKESLAESKDADIFADRHEISHTLRRYGGSVALSYMERDPRFVDALNILYNIYKDKTYEQKLTILANKYSFDTKGDLPSFITDAVMFEKVFVLDALNMSRADLRIVAYHPAQIFDKELATDAQGKVLQFLGQNMRFTESPLMKMGWYDASNARFNYEAMVPDTREYNPDKYWDQRDKIWQHCFMFLLELNDRRHDLTRKYMSEDEIITFGSKPEDPRMTATPGQTGEYLNYQNTRYKRKKGETQGEYDHRRGVFERIQAMQAEDAQSRAAGGPGKAGWNEPIDPNNPKSLTVRQAVNGFVLFMQRDYSGANSLVINGVTIDKGANEIFYNDELAVLLNDFEANPNDPAFAGHKNEMMAFLNMRDVLRDHRCWGFVFDLNDQEVQKRVFNNMDITFAENYDIAASESKNLLVKLTRAEASSDIYALQVTPAQILDAVTEFGHRRHNTQNYWPMMRFLAFAEAAMLRRLTEMEIASMQDLTKYIDPMGQVRLGATEEIQRLLGVRRETYFAHRALLGEIENKGYMEKMKDQRLVLAEKGLIRNWTNAMRSYVEKLRDAEALQWAQQRDIPLQQMAGMYEEIADGYDESGYFPVESWQVMDVVTDGHEIHRRNLLIQSLNRTQLFNFFEQMSFEEAGEAFGGARKIALDFRGFKDTAIREEPSETSHEVKSTDIDKKLVKTYLMVQRHVNGGGEWFKIATETGEHIGWVNANEVDFAYDPNDNETAPLRQGEVTHRGGRFVWEKSRSGWGWQWVTGSWQQSYDGMESHFDFKPGNGFERRLQLGARGPAFDAFSVDRLKGTSLEVKGDSTLQPTKVIHSGMVRVQPANYPFLKFKSEEHREYFYNMRQHMLLSLLLGRPIQAEKAVGSGAESPRASGAALPSNMYQAKVGNFMQMLQFGYWITTQMRSVETYAACRGALIASLKRFFGVETPANEIIEKQMEIYKMLMLSRTWGSDRETGKRFISEISAMTFVRHGNESLTERLKAGVKRKRGLLLKAAALRLGIKATELEVGKINGPGIALAAWPVSKLVALSIFGGLGWGWTIAGGIGAYLVAKLGVDWVGGKLANQIDPDVSNIDLTQFPYLREYDAFVPVE